MRIIEPSVRLVTSTQNPERVIEEMGRICYQSDHKVIVCGKCHGLGWREMFVDSGSEIITCSVCGGIGTMTAIDFINKIKSNGHESVLEHASASFKIITDRGVTHEIVRHRIGMSYSQESTRYCNYAQDRFGLEIGVIRPPNLEIEMYGIWQHAMKDVEIAYLSLIDRKVAPQIARSVLPNSLKSEIGVTGNFRSWRHFLKLRTSPKAHPQMRQIAEMLRAKLMEISPVCFGDIP